MIHNLDPNKEPHFSESMNRIDRKNGYNENQSKMVLLLEARGIHWLVAMLHGLNKVNPKISVTLWNLHL